MGITVRLSFQSMLIRNDPMSDEKLLFFTLDSTFFFLLDREIYASHTLNTSLHGPNNEHFQRHLNGRKLISYFCSSHVERRAFWGTVLLTNKQTNKTLLQESNRLFFLERNYQLQTKYQEKAKRKARHSFIKIFIIMMCGESY